MKWLLIAGTTCYVAFLVILAQGISVYGMHRPVPLYLSIELGSLLTGAFVCLGSAVGLFVRRMVRRARSHRQRG